MRATRLKLGDSRCSVCNDLSSNVKQRVSAQSLDELPLSNYSSVKCFLNRSLASTALLECTTIPMHLHIGCTLALLVGSSRALVTPGSSGRLLVCGGSGFLGREVCREAVARGWAVTSLSRRGVNPEPGSTLDAVKVTLTVDAQGNQ